MDPARSEIYRKQRLILERMDKVWEQRAQDITGVDLYSVPPSYVAGAIHGRIVDDEISLASWDWVARARSVARSTFRTMRAFGRQPKRSRQGFERSGLPHR